MKQLVEQGYTITDHAAETSARASANKAFSLRVRTSIKAGDMNIIDPTDPSYTALGVSGKKPMDFENIP